MNKTVSGARPNLWAVATETVGEERAARKCTVAFNCHSVTAL